jgi:hypothetical protein
MGRGKPLANAPYPRPMSCLWRFADWMTCVRLETLAANAGRQSGHGQRCCRRTVLSGSVALAIVETGARRVELRKGLAAIGRYLSTHQLSPERTLIRLDGQYGNGAVLSDVAGFAFVTRGKDYRLLDHPLMRGTLALASRPGATTPAIRQMERSLYDCPAIPVGSLGTLYRVVVATHPAGKKKSPVGITRKGVVYELFFTNLPQAAFTACDVVELYGALAVPSSLLFQTKIESRTRTVGAAIGPLDRNAGKRSLNGSGTSDWNWGISWTQRPCASPHLLLPSRSRTRKLPRVRPYWLPRLDMAHPLRPHPGKRVASLDPISRSSLMEPCAVQQAARSRESHGGKRLMGACGWCMPPAFAGVVPVSCVSSASGKGAPPKSRAKSACFCIRLLLALLPCSGTIGAGECIGAPACNCSVANELK